MTLIAAKPLRIADAPVLRRLGVYRGSLKRVEASIRKLLTISDNDCFLVTRATKDREEETGFIALIPDVFHTETGRLTLLCPSQDLLPTLLEMAVRTGFTERGFLRIETQVPVDQPDAIAIYEASGFQTDCVLPGSSFRLLKPVDQHQMSLLKTRSAWPAVGLVPYRLGLIAVTGTAAEIDSLNFLGTGEPVPQTYIKDVLHIWQLLDKNDRLILPPERLEAALAEPKPSMVRKAVEELNQYLAGESVTFDLQMHLACGSEFQQKVWAALRQIPFGTTVTYLDIALQLTDGDLKKARALTRAVGSACGANPVPIIIPCHRVIGQDGRLTGYSGGIQNKEFLLEHEMFGLR